MSDRQWVRRWSKHHLSVVARPMDNGCVSVAVMPRTWRPETNKKSPVAVVALSRTDLMELLEMTKEASDANP